MDELHRAMGVIAIFLIFLLVFAMHAYSEAHDDAMKIADDQEIDHGAALLDRMLTGMLISAVVIAFESQERGLWHVLLLLPIGWAWWTMVFRFCLNRMRGLDWRYVSPSNVYDWQFIRLTLGWEDKYLFRANAERLHNHNYFGTERSFEYIDKIHRAGAIAYAFEITVFAGSTAAYFLPSSMPG